MIKKSKTMFQLSHSVSFLILTFCIEQLNCIILMLGMCCSCIYHYLCSILDIITYLQHLQDGKYVVKYQFYNVELISDLKPASAG